MSGNYSANAAVIACACMLAAPTLLSAEEVLPEVNVTDKAMVKAHAKTLTVPNTEQATVDIQRIPGAVEVVPDAAFKSGPAQTVKDMLGWVPGIFAQPRYGDDARISIRGSGLSRAYGNRGINMYMDGVPINTADGLVDNFEIDPTAFRYIEVYKGANAMRYGANTLGGAINYVTPTGRDADLFVGRMDVASFGYRRFQASTGGVQGPLDYFITASAQEFDGYRQHSEGDQQRLSGNVGYQFSPDAETRFYVNLNAIDQRLPGEVSKAAALNSPRVAASEFTRLDQQRNINSQRLANKTTLRFGSTTVDIGVFGVHRHVAHPIFQYLDYSVRDYGGFVRATDDSTLWGLNNRLVVGANIHNGKTDNDQYINLNGSKGALAASNIDRSKNMSVYVDDTLSFLPNVALVIGAQYLHAERDRKDRFLSNGDQSGSRSYDLFSPKLGLLWDVDAAWQVFGNISRSAEVPTYDANTFSAPAASNLSAQTATTYEIGTRGTREDVMWDVAIYHADIKNELQCLTTAPWSPCAVVNAGKTVHRGLEAGVGLPLLRSIFSNGDSLLFNAAYTYNDFRFDNDPVYGNNRLPGVPKHYLRSELLYKQPNGFYAGPNIEWSPSAYFADNTNQTTVDRYILLNFRLGYMQPKGWSGYVEGRNLADRRYIANVAVAGTANAAMEIFNPGIGRAAYAGLQYKW